MTAYEAETMTQMREISELRAEVKRLNQIILSNTESITLLSQRLTEMQQLNEQLNIRCNEYESKYWSKCDW